MPLRHTSAVFVILDNFRSVFCSLSTHRHAHTYVGFKVVGHLRSRRHLQDWIVFFTVVVRTVELSYSSWHTAYLLCVILALCSGHGLLVDMMRMC